MNERPRVDLCYPLYLDKSMMVSFLAAIEDGVAYSSTVKKKSGDRHDTSLEANAQGRASAIVQLLSFDLRGKLAKQSEITNSEELQVERSHTEASLLNVLRSALLDDNRVVDLNTEGSKWQSIRPGEIVEISGTFRANPLEESLSVFGRLGPLFHALPPEFHGDSAIWQPSVPHEMKGMSNKSKPAANQPLQGRNGQLSQHAQLDAVFKLIESMRDDLAKSDMIDAILESRGSSPVKCVVTLSRNFGTGRTIDSLVGSELTILGKVTRNVEDGGTISLVRRSALSYIDGVVPALLGVLQGSPGLQLQTLELEIKGPCLQLLPLAIFA